MRTNYILRMPKKPIVPHVVRDQNGHILSLKAANCLIRSRILTTEHVRKLGFTGLNEYMGSVVIEEVLAYIDTPGTDLTALLARVIGDYRRLGMEPPRGGGLRQRASRPRRPVRANAATVTLDGHRLTPRISNALLNAGITSAEELRKLGYHGLRQIDGIGPYLAERLWLLVWPEGEAPGVAPKKKPGPEGLWRHKDEKARPHQMKVGAFWVETELFEAFERKREKLGLFSRTDALRQLMEYFVVDVPIIQPAETEAQFESRRAQTQG